jgi:hypothetical protein
MPEQILRITGWNKYFECSQSRHLKKMLWVPVPVNLAGDGITDLINHQNGAAHFGSWIALVEIGAQCEPRGTLVRGNGRPHNAESFSRITRIPVEMLTEAISRLLEIGWLEHCTVGSLQDAVPILRDSVPIPQNTALDLQAATATGRNGRKDSTGKTERLCSSDNDEHGAAVLELSPPRSKPPDEIKVWFDALFWLTYPRRVGKPQALKAARRHGKTAGERAAIMACLERQLPALRGQFRTDGDYRPYPASWLNREPWHDPSDEAETPVNRATRVKDGGITEAIRMLNDERGNNL